MLRDALRFAESLGFSMEPVNLNYGKALREVIVKGIRAFSLIPGGKKNSPSPIPQVKPALKPPAGGSARDKHITPPEAPSAEKYIVEEASLDISLDEAAPIEDVPFVATPFVVPPVEATPVEETVVEAVPLEETAVEETAVEETAVEETAVE
jgi:hypothetical protein